MIKNCRKDFPALKRKINGKKLVYFDNAATTQKPRQVIDAIKDYYENHNANVHRGVHTLSAEATEAYESAHDKAADFINADNQEEVVFTKNTTESLNIVANSFRTTLRKGDEIVLTRMEHHSNLVPWLNTAKFSGAKIRYADIDENGKLKPGQFRTLMSKKTKVVALTHASNVLGTINPVREITEAARRNNAAVVLDAAQSVPHMPVDVKKLDVDFMAFSGHKMMGPTGIGVLYGKRETLSKTKPFSFGGDMIKEVRFDRASWNDLPWKFEAGTPNIAGGVGLGAAIDYLNKIGMRNVREHEAGITGYAMKKLENLEGVEIYGPGKTRDRGGVVSFNVKGVHPHDLSSILDSQGIAVRGGHHCAMPLMGLLGIQGSARASFYAYNTRKEVDRFAAAVERARKIMKV